MPWFTDPADAVSCARSLLAAFEDRDLGATPDRIAIRLGLARGHPILRDGDLFGATLVEAVRLCAEAAPGTGLATAEVQAGLEETLPTAGERMLEDSTRDVFDPR